MTSDELNRAIEFLLNAQANSEVRLERIEQQMEQTNQQLAQTNQQVSAMAETQTEFIQTMTRHVEAQAGINADMRRTMRGLAAAQQQTQKDISDLTKVVNNLVSFVSENGDTPGE